MLSGKKITSVVSQYVRKPDCNSGKTLTIWWRKWSNKILDKTTDNREILIIYQVIPTIFLFVQNNHNSILPLSWSTGLLEMLFIRPESTVKGWEAHQSAPATFSKSFFPSLEHSDIFSNEYGLYSYISRLYNHFGFVEFDTVCISSDLFLYHLSFISLFLRQVSLCLFHLSISVVSFLDNLSYVFLIV